MTLNIFLAYKASRARGIAGLRNGRNLNLILPEHSAIAGVFGKIGSRFSEDLISRDGGN